MPDEHFVSFRFRFLVSIFFFTENFAFVEVLPLGGFVFGTKSEVEKVAGDNFFGRLVNFFKYVRFYLKIKINRCAGVRHFVKKQTHLTLFLFFSPSKRAWKEPTGQSVMEGVLAAMNDDQQIIYAFVKNGEDISVEGLHFEQRKHF